jgi:hypothetical protein
VRFLSPRAGEVNNQGRMMEKVLEKKKVVKKVEPKVDQNLLAIEQLTKLNGNLVEQIKDMASEIDNLKDRIAQVASRLGL